MKRIIILTALFLATGLVASAQGYTREGNVFASTERTSTSKAQDTLTPFTWKDSKGNQYPIYVTPRKKCYVIRTSAKTGKNYKQYLPKEVTDEIIKELEK